MNVTIDATNLNWMTNGNGLWAANIDDLTGNSAVFSAGYTPTITNKLVKVSNATRPVGTVTYASDTADAAASAPLYAVGTARDTEDAVSGTLTQNIRHISLPTTGWTEYSYDIWAGFGAGAILPVVEDRARYVTSNAIIPSLTTATPTAPQDRVSLWVGVSQSKGLYVVWHSTNVTPPAAWLTDGEPDASKFMTWLASNPVDVYYATATPVVTTGTGTAIALTAGIDNVVQTDGGRTADFTLNYDGLDYTVPLDTTRKYAFNDNGTTSMLENASSQDVRIGEDMLVDIDQLVNGNSTKKAAITSWNDLKAQYPEYKAYVQYNAGQVMGVQPTVSANGYVRNQWFSNGDFSSGKTGWWGNALSSDVVDGKLVMTTTSASYINYYIAKTVTGLANHIYMYAVQMDMPHDSVGNIRFGNSAPSTQVSFTSGNHLVYAKITAPSVNASTVYIYPAEVSGYANYTIGETMTLDDAMLVDLTQLFGGNQARIDSIQTWADLVAAVPAYANYVAYDTGTAVAGGGSVTAFAPLYRVGTARDTEDCVGGTRTQVLATIDWTQIASQSSYSTSDNVNNSGIIRFIFQTFNMPAAQRKKTGVTNCMSSHFVTVTSVMSESYNQEGIGGTSYNTNLLLCIKADRLTGDLTTVYGRKQALLAWASANNLMLYYELETPVTTSLTPQSMSTVNGSNTVYQTDGGRVADFDLGYKGTDYTLALDSSHKYGFKHGSTGSILTGASSQAVVAGSDMVVDVTRLVNGDSAKISAVAAWSDIVAGYPEYASYVQYNAGEVKGLMPTVLVNSHVRNQLVQNGDFSNGTSGWSAASGSMSVVSGVLNLVTTTPKSSFGIYQYRIIPAGHTCVCIIDAMVPHTSSGYIRLLGSNGETASERAVSFIENTRTTRTVFLPATTQQATVIRWYAMTGSWASYQTTDVIYVYSMQFIDLTEMFGGNQTMIDSIQTWDDLVAIDASYATYCAYNTGEVVLNDGYTHGGSMTASAPLHGIGTARDSENGVYGKRTATIGSYTFTGNEAWYEATASGHSHKVFYSQDVMRGRLASYKVVSSKYVNHNSSWSSAGTPDKCCCGGDNPNSYRVLYVIDDSLADASACASAMAGSTVYYELAEPAITDVTPSAISLQNGDNIAYQADGGRTADFTLDYDGTDYSIDTDASRKYIKRINGTDDYITGGSPIEVVGKRDKLIDLTYMFGAGKEPDTVAAFYHLFPTWMGYNVPYDGGSVLNFKGTGIVTVGFNLVDFGGRTLGAPQNTSSGNTAVRGPFDETKFYVGLSYLNYYYPNYVENYSISSNSITITNKYGTWYGLAFPIRCIPGATYKWEISSAISSMARLGLSFYTYNGSFISGHDITSMSSSSVVAPTNAYWLMVAMSPYGSSSKTATFTNPCVHLQWSGTRNGDYEQYWSYTRPLPTLTYFQTGMNGIGTVADEISNKQAVQRLRMVNLADTDWTESAGTWVHQFNDIKADTPNIAATGHQAFTLSGQTGTITSQPTGYLVYELGTPVTTVFADEVNLSYQVSDYGTESIVPVNGASLETAPILAVVQYQGDYARTITKLPENYQSQKSMDALLELLGQLHNGVIQSTFNAATQSYGYTFTPNE